MPAPLALCQGVNPKKLEDTTQTRGIIKALATALSGYRMILTGEDICSNFTIGRLPCPGTRRLGVFPTIMRELLYLADRNMPFSNGAHDVLMGKGSTDALLRTIRKERRCSETGTQTKMSAALGPLDRGSFGRSSEQSIVRICLETLSKQLTSPGGMDSTIIERLFSELRMLGQKMPYRPGM